MAFRHVTLSDKVRVEGFALAIKKAKIYQRKPSISPKFVAIFFLSALALILLFYHCMLYLGAYIDVKNLLNVPENQATASPHSLPKNKNTLGLSEMDYFSFNKGYMREGQALELTYTIPQNTRLVLSIKRCKSPVIIEMFMCQGGQTYSQIISDRTHGLRSLHINTSDFYTFDTQLQTMDGQPLVLDYTAYWNRDYRQMPQPLKLR